MSRKENIRCQFISKKTLFFRNVYDENDSSSIFYSLVEPGRLFPVSNYCFISTGWFQGSNGASSVFISDSRGFGTFYRYLLENNFKYDVKEFFDTFLLLNGGSGRKISFIGGRQYIKDSYASGLAWESLILPPLPTTDYRNVYLHFNEMTDEDKNFVINVCWFTAIFSLYCFDFRNIKKVIILNPFTCFKMYNKNTGEKEGGAVNFVFYDPFQTCLKDLEGIVGGGGGGGTGGDGSGSTKTELLVFLYMMKQLEYFQALINDSFLQKYLYDKGAGNGLGKGRRRWIVSTVQ